MTTFLISLVTLLAGIALGFVVRQRWENRNDDQSDSPEQAGELGPLYKLAESLQTYFDQSAHPKDLLTHSEFERGVKMLLGDKYSTNDLLNYVAGTNGVKIGRASCRERVSSPV